VRHRANCFIASRWRDVSANARETPVSSDTFPFRGIFKGGDTAHQGVKLLTRALLGNQESTFNPITIVICNPRGESYESHD
jgi:hypothetical protein